MKGRGRLLAVLFGLLVAGPARASSPWDVPTLGLELRGSDDSDRFPNSSLSAPDRGAQLSGSVETGRRLGRSTKLGLALEAGGELWSEFSEASYGWAGLSASVRRGATQVRADVEATPSRLKFPADADGGEFSRLETRLGVRQVVSPNLRLRLEGRRQDDDFVTLFDARDAATNEGYALATLRAGNVVTLRGDALVGRTRTNAAKYAHSDRVVGGGATAALGKWRLDAGVWSGIARYTDAVSGDSNYRRRDQWLQLRGEVRRELHPGLTAILAGEWTDQTSSRLDRAYDRRVLQLGLAWTRAGE